jgi:hypothetical protein
VRVELSPSDSWTRLCAARVVPARCVAPPVSDDRQRQRAPAPPTDRNARTVEHAPRELRVVNRGAVEALVRVPLLPPVHAHLHRGRCHRSPPHPSSAGRRRPQRRGRARLIALLRLWLRYRRRRQRHRRRLLHDRGVGTTLRAVPQAARGLHRRVRALAAHQPRAPALLRRRDHLRVGLERAQLVRQHAPRHARGSGEGQQTAAAIFHTARRRCCLSARAHIGREHRRNGDVGAAVTRREAAAQGELLDPVLAGVVLVHRLPQLAPRRAEERRRGVQVLHGGPMRPVTTAQAAPAQSATMLTA